MKLNKKLLLSAGTIAAIIAPVAGVIACGSKNKEENRVDTFDVGLELAYAPYNFALTSSQYNSIVKGHSDLEAITARTWDGNYGAGYDVYVANQVSKQLHEETVLHAHDWDGLIPSLRANLFDAVVAGMSNTPERGKQVDFSNTYMRPHTGILVHASSAEDFFNKYSGASGLVVYAQKGTSWAKMLDGDPGADNEEDIKGKLHGTTARINTTLPNAQIVNTTISSHNNYIALEEDTIGQDVAAHNRNLTFIPFTDANWNSHHNWWGSTVENPDGTPEEIAIAIRKGNTTLKSAANHVLGSSYDVLTEHISSTSTMTVATAVNKLLSEIHA